MQRQTKENDKNHQSHLSNENIEHSRIAEKTGHPGNYSKRFKLHQLIYHPLSFFMALNLLTY